jgi:type I restriction enzyme S subunit
MSRIPLNAFCALTMGQSPDSESYNIEHNGFPFYQGNADFGRIHPMVRVWCSAPKKLAKAGDILISVRAPIGALNIADCDCCIGRGLAAITPDATCADTMFLFYALYASAAELQRRGTGSTFKAISKNALSNLLLPSYCLEEQKEISAVLQQVDHLIALRQRQAEKLDELVKARFVEMFGDPVLNCQGFPVRTIGELTTEVKYGTSKPAVEGGKYPYLRMNNLTIDGKLDLHDLKQIDVDTSEFEKCVVRKGDVLFNRTNSAELVGKTAYYGLDEEMIIAGYIIRVRVNNLILPQYLSFYMNMPFMKQRIRSMAKGAVNQANINSKELKSIKVIVPPLEVQGKVVEYEERIDREKDRIQRSAALLETLKRSLMQQYFG